MNTIKYLNTTVKARDVCSICAVRGSNGLVYTRPAHNKLYTLYSTKLHLSHLYTRGKYRIRITAGVVFHWGMRAPADGSLPSFWFLSRFSSWINQSDSSVVFPAGFPGLTDQFDHPVWSSGLTDRFGHPVWSPGSVARFGRLVWPPGLVACLEEGRNLSLMSASPDKTYFIHLLL